MFLPLLQTPPAFEFRVEPGKGLTIVAGGVPLVRGSYVQIVSPDWKRSYFSSAGGTEKVEQIDVDTVRVTFHGAEVEGTDTYHREGDRLKVHYEFKYAGEGEAMVELAAGLAWLPALSQSSTPAPPATETIGGRRLGPSAPFFRLPGPLGILEGGSNVPLTVFDARRYPQSWAEGKDLLWIGDLGVPLEKGKTTAVDIEWHVPTAPIAALPSVKRTLTATAMKDARLPDESRPLIVPKPENDHLNFNSPIEITGAWNLPIGEFDHLNAFKAALARRFVLPPIASTTKKVNLDGGVSKLGLNPGGYRITIRGDRGVSVLGEEDTGLRNAVERLASLAFVRDGKLWLPTGYLYDQPKIRWRGVHLFAGPKARSFQRDLWTRVLRPLGFDHVVLECERTAWDATPGIATADTTSKAELASLFSMYRNLGVDAVPLIQSFGHMDWLFANGKNLDLAMNPEVPYAVDPRKPRTKAVLGAVWDEAITLAKPTAIHFGLDEVAMRGWTGGDAFLTDTWKLQLGFLDQIARKHDAAPMLWGDQALFGKEAPDAALAGTAADASTRRAAIPKGSFVADWHYLDDPKPESYLPVLQLWKDAGTRPIAATWYRPDNIRGFALAAATLDVGLLQTTWAGYSSSEAGMLEHASQFGAMVLAADYAWSGRTEKPAELPYDPNELFRKLYYGRPTPLKPMPGTALGGTASFSVGGIRFQAVDLRIASVLKPNPDAGGAIEIDTNAKGRELDLSLACEVPAQDGDAVAEVTVERTGAPPIVERLVYGRDVRALTDPVALTKGDRMTAGPSCFRVDLGKPGTAVSRMTIRPLNAYSGLRIMGATLVD